MSGRVLITGGAGFIGTNVADRVLSSGREVVILDDLSRPGVTNNLSRLRERHATGLTVVVGDVGKPEVVRRALTGVENVFHFAAQVAVTSSMADPMHDFNVNLGGTISLLEEIRRLDAPPALLFTSTNKVYGGLEDVELRKRADRYEPVDRAWRTHGISEKQPLDFCSPYGCSKGGADQYVLDYAKSFGIPALVFRMSCIYGPHQCGNEDQGWVAHFLKQAMAGKPITLYGDGCQVRDILYVDDLVDSMLVALAGIDQLRGRAFNMGGGASNTVSLLELLELISELEARPTQVDLGPWRVGDQRWYVSDTRGFSAATGWKPRVGVAEGAARLHSWLVHHDASDPPAEVLLSVAEAR